MKILSARIRNFKLLREIDLTFSVDPQKPLTIIRAENGSGKTSTLQALRWGLYGKDVLDDIHVRLSPADWPDNTKCTISVEIDFVHTAVSKVDDETMTTETIFSLKREVQEKPQGDYPNRGKERVILYEKTPAGAEEKTPAESWLAQMLPKEMIDIFFTDGDAAMSFISPQLSENTKRDKVKDAIRSLLGLDLLERVEKRISTTQSEVNKKIKKVATSNELVEITNEIEEETKKKVELSEKVNELKTQIDNIQKKFQIAERELTRALEAGSYEQLVGQKETFLKQSNQAIEEEEKLKRKHQELFKEKSLSWQLLENYFKKGYDHLNNLHEKGIIPRASVPVLEERLALEECICGADLSEGTIERENVYRLINQQRKNDSEVDLLTSLYFQSNGEMEAWAEKEINKWDDYASDLRQERVIVKKRITIAKDELKLIEAKIDQIGREEIEQKQKQKKMLLSALTGKNNKLGGLEVSLKDTEHKLKEFNQKQKTLSLAEAKMVGLNAEKTVLNDLQNIVQSSLDEMRGIYINRVTNRMNDLFLDMVGADPEQNAVFQKVQISNNYNIVVNTKDNRTLDPDTEVNGASQRALTFAFIWALTEVSGVVAPRVIDTPLGMMSGNVKRRVLEMVSRAAGEDVDRQVILFLTQSEISHTENILDKQSGVTCTLIKTDDYPVDLMNNPEVNRSEIRLCNCSHREYCDQCQRKNHAEFQLSYRAT